MKKYLNIIYYVKTILFILSLIAIFLISDIIVKVGVFGYIYLLFESIYIVISIISYLKKKKRFLYEISLSFMQIGLSFYQIIMYLRTLFYKVSFANINSFIYYRNNFLILSSLIITIVLYILFLNLDDKNKA